jgi:hypothetical protein
MTKLAEDTVRDLRQLADEIESGCRIVTMVKDSSNGRRDGIYSVATEIRRNAESAKQ